MSEFIAQNRQSEDVLLKALKEIQGERFNFPDEPIMSHPEQKVHHDATDQKNDEDDGEEDINSMIDDDDEEEYDDDEEDYDDGNCMNVEKSLKK